MATQAGERYTTRLCIFLHNIMRILYFYHTPGSVSVRSHEILCVSVLQVEASNQMYKAVLEQVSKFLEKAHTSLNAGHDKLNLPVKHR